MSNQGKCPVCGGATWEDNFWSGCNNEFCGWQASCEKDIKLVKKPVFAFPQDYNNRDGS